MSLPIIETRDLRKVFRTVKRVPGAARGAAHALLARVRRSRRRRRASRCRSSRASWSATSAPTAPANRRRSRCSPAFSSRPPARSASPDWSRGTPSRERPQHRRRLRPAQPALLGPAADRIVRAAARDLRHSRATATGATWTSSSSMLEMDEFLRTPVRQLSLGQRMRGDFAAALAARSADRLSRRADDRPRRRGERRDPAFIARINAERGTTIVLTTHDLAEVERLCRRIVLIDRGTLIYDGGHRAHQERVRTLSHAGRALLRAGRSIRISTAPR